MYDTMRKNVTDENDNEKDSDSDKEGCTVEEVEEDVKVEPVAAKPLTQVVAEAEAEAERVAAEPEVVA